MCRRLSPPTWPPLLLPGLLHPAAIYLSALIASFHPHLQGVACLFIRSFALRKRAFRCSSQRGQAATGKTGKPIDVHLIPLIRFFLLIRLAMGTCALVCSGARSEWEGGCTEHLVLGSPPLTFRICLLSLFPSDALTDPSAGQHASFAYHPAHYHQHRPPPLEEPSYPYYNQPPAQEPPRNRSPSVSSVDSQSSYATTSSLNYLAADLSLGSQTSSCSSSNLPPLPPPPPVGEYIPPPQAGIHGPPKKKSHSKPKPEGHVPRPRNAFILFRTDVYTRNLIKNENKHGKISQIVADMWKNVGCLPLSGSSPCNC
jgi:hypothetical protein